MFLMWCPCGFRLVFVFCSCGLRMVSWNFRDFSNVFVWCSCGCPMFSQGVRMVARFRMVVSLFYCRVVSFGFLLVSHVSRMAVAWFSIDHRMDFVWLSHGVRMVFICFPNAIRMLSMSHYPLGGQGLLD